MVGFNYNFSGSKVTPETTSKNYAKATLLGNPLEDRRYDTGDQWATSDMNRERGLRNDVDTIVRIVSGTFK